MLFLLLGNILPSLLYVLVAIAFCLGADTVSSKGKNIFHSLVICSVSKSTEPIAEVNHEAGAVHKGQCSWTVDTSESFLNQELLQMIIYFSNKGQPCDLG